MLCVYHCEGGALYKVIRLKDRKRFRELMDRYNIYGYLGGAPYTPDRKDLVYVKDGDWCYLFIIHRFNNPTVAFRNKVNPFNSWFIRRMCMVKECRDKYGDVAVEALKCLLQYLKHINSDAVFTIAMQDDIRWSGAVFKKSGFEEIGKTANGKGKWFMVKFKN